MFNLRLCNAATIRYSLLKYGHMHLCRKGFKYFSPHCCRCNSFGCIAAITCGNACDRPHSESVYSGSEHRQFNSPRLVKREVGFPNSWGAPIGSNQLWRVNDSPYCREYMYLWWNDISGDVCECLLLVQHKRNLARLRIFDKEISFMCDEMTFYETSVNVFLYCNTNKIFPGLSILKGDVHSPPKPYGRLAHPTSIWLVLQKFI